MRIGEIAELTGISVSNVRFYTVLNIRKAYL